MANLKEKPLPPPGPIPAKRKETVMMRKLKDGSIHPVLFEFVVKARAMGFELVDRQDYEEQKKLRDGCRVAEGETIAPETAKKKRSRSDAPSNSNSKMSEVASEVGMPGETRFVPFG